MSKIILSGVKPTGQPHIGNYVGMLKPALDLAQYKDYNTYYFIADYHALNSVQNADQLTQLIYEVVASYLALGLDPDKTIFYKQSDIPEIFEISYALSCVCPKGFMNRAHAYKAAVAEKADKGMKDPDAGINMGLYNYPILMAADILAFDTNLVPVGKDQKQHVEYARDLAIKFNNVFGDVFKVPEISIRADVPILPGIDGRKMSKSYNNTIPLFCSSQELRKKISKIKTDSKGPGEPKNPEESFIYTYYKEVASNEETAEFATDFRNGISYATAKQMLYEKMNSFLEEPRRKFHEHVQDKNTLRNILQNGKDQARSKSRQVKRRLREAIGIF